jgi:hypothetical protein
MATPDPYWTDGPLPDPSLWGFVKSPFPAFEDFPSAGECIGLPTMSEHRAEQRRLSRLQMESIRRGVSDDQVSTGLALQRIEEQNFWKILACSKASAVILGWRRQVLIGAVAGFEARC